MPDNQDVTDGLFQVREALREVAASVSNLTPKGELDRAAKVVTEDNRRWRRSITLLIIGGPVLFLLNMGILIQSRHNENVYKKDTRQGISCLLGEISTHRHDARTFELAVTNKLGIEDFGQQLHAPSPIPEDRLNDLVRRCGPVINRFVSVDTFSGKPYTPQIPLHAEGESGQSKRTPGTP